MHYQRHKPSRNSWGFVRLLVPWLLFSSLFAICISTKAQDTFSPQLNHFVECHPQALLILSNAVVKTKGSAGVRIDTFYFYTDDETVPTAHHNWALNGSPQVAIYIRGGGQPVDEYLNFLFEVINTRGDKVFKELFQQAASNQISKSNFVRGVLLQEFQAAKAVQKLLTQLGLKPDEITISKCYDDFLNTPDDFDKFLSYAKDPARQGAEPGYEELYDRLTSSIKSDSTGKTNTAVRTK
jgi:hypothetical protein